MQGIIALMAMVTGVILLISSQFIPPMGVIDTSNLIAFGEIATFVGACIGIDYNYKGKLINNNKNEGK